MNPARVYLSITQREDLEQGECLLLLLVAGDVLQHCFGLAILSDDEGLRLVTKISHNLRGMSFEVADRFYLLG